MAHSILIPINDSITAKQTIESIIKHHDKFPSNLTLLHVINRDQLAYKMIPDLQLEMVKKNARKAGKQLLENFGSQLEKVGFTCELVLETGDPWQSITNFANENDTELVVIGRHEGGGQIRDVLFGSVANHVLHNVKCPVLLF
jgi:nucleotide-binding universal stress UspA family protein